MTMPKPSKMLVLLLSVFLSGCESLQYKAEQCSPFFVYTDESKKMIDSDKSVCNCRQYEYSQAYVGPLSGTYQAKPLDYCNKVVGHKNQGAFAAFCEEVRIEVNKGIEKMFNPYED